MSYRFDADTDYIVNVANLPSVTAWTVLVRFKMSVNLGDYGTIFKVGQAATGAYEIDLGGDGVTLIGWNGVDEVGGSVLEVDRWYDITATCSGTGAGQFVIYLNGAVNITLDGNAGVTMEQITVGRYHITSAQLPVNGCVQDIMVYGRVLSQREIAAQTKQRVPVVGAGLLHWLPCKDAPTLGFNYGGVNGLWTMNGTITEEQGPFVPWVLPSRKRSYFVVGGGVLYTATLAASFTPAGLVVKQVNKLLAGAVTPGGVVRRQPNKVLGGSVTPAGSVVKRVLKVLSGVVTPVGTVMVTAIYAIVLSGALAVSGNAVKQVNKRLAGTIAPSGNLMKQVNKVLNGTVTPVGSLVKQVNKVLSGLITPTGALTVRATYSVILAGAIGIAGVLTKQVNKVLSASLVPTGLMSKQKNMSLAGALGVSGNVVKQVQKVLAASLSPTGALTTARRMVVVLAGTLEPVGELVKQVNKRLFASVGVSGGLVKQVNKVLNATLSPTGLVRKQVDKVLSGVITPVGSLTSNRIFQVVLNGALSITGAIASVFINGSGVVIRGLVPWIRRRRR